VLLPTDNFIGKGRSCNTDRSIGTSLLLHNDTPSLTITATWRIYS